MICVTHSDRDRVGGPRSEVTEGVVFNQLRGVIGQGRLRPLHRQEDRIELQPTIHLRGAGPPGGETARGFVC